MPRSLVARITIGTLTALFIIVLVSYRTVAFPSRPLSKSELLALVAGKVVPENIAFEIRSRGLNFSPDMAYNGLLKQTGAGTGVFVALSSARSSTAANSADESADLLRHLS